MREGISNSAGLGGGGNRERVVEEGASTWVGFLCVE